MRPGLIVRKRRVEATVCRDCGMATQDAGEYHPYAFCVLYKAGIDPWEQVRMFAGQLGLGDPGAKPPLVTEIHGGS